MLKDFTREKFDIILQAGQSNSDGCGKGNVANPYIPDENIWYLNKDYTISIASERVIGNNIFGDMSLIFAKKYIEEGLLRRGRRLLIVRAAQNGTGFTDGHWRPSDDIYLRMLKMTQTSINLNPENRLKVMLWHQGETDAVLNAGYENHYRNLKSLILKTREHFDVRNLPFIAGDFVHQWKNENIEQSIPVSDAIRAVCSDIGYAKFVETFRLYSNDQKINDMDKIHFCRESLYELGSRYFYSYKSIYFENCY